MIKSAPEKRFIKTPPRGPDRWDHMTGLRRNHANSENDKFDTGRGCPTSKEPWGKVDRDQYRTKDTGMEY